MALAVSGLFLYKRFRNTLTYLLTYMPETYDTMMTEETYNREETEGNRRGDDEAGHDNT